MRRWARRGGVAFVGFLVLAQLIRIDRTNPPVEGDVATTPDMQKLLRRACYDCHSNETVWPWYSGVAPVSWLVGHDVHEGREELNFSAWAASTPAQRTKLLKETAEDVADGDMPPWYYALVHPEARLDAAARERIQAWTAAELGAPAR